MSRDDIYNITQTNIPLRTDHIQPHITPRGRISSVYAKWRQFLADHSTERFALMHSVTKHAAINPMEDVPVLGDLRFLSDADRLEANRRGYVTPHDVSSAQRRGELAAGFDENAGPMVVFWPTCETPVNPIEQPRTGAWRFSTGNGTWFNRSLAARNLGGTHGLPASPSAGQIRRLGELFEQYDRPNLVADIELEWVWGEEDVEDDIIPNLEESDYDPPVPEASTAERESASPFNKRPASDQPSFSGQPESQTGLVADEDKPRNEIKNARRRPRSKDPLKPTREKVRPSRRVPEESNTAQQSQEDKNSTGEAQSTHAEPPGDLPAAPEPIPDGLANESTATHSAPSAASLSNNEEPHNDAPVDPTPVT
jgi:hypothetical protein